MTCSTLLPTHPSIPRWLLLLVVVSAATFCAADPIVFTNGDASHIVSGQAINGVREGSQFTLSDATTLTSLDFNFFTAASPVMNKVDWWFYTSDPLGGASPIAAGSAPVSNVFLGKVEVASTLYSDYTGTIPLPNVSAGAGTFYVVVGDATAGVNPVTTYWAIDSTVGSTSVFWESAGGPNGTWEPRTVDFIFDLRGAPAVPEPSPATLLASSLPLALYECRRRLRPRW